MSESEAPAPRGKGKKKPSVAPIIRRIDTTHSMGRVGVIALVGFVIGVAWPRLAGVSLVPEAPIESISPSTEVDVEEASPAPVPEDVKEITAGDRLQISEAQITSCRDSEGKKLTACGAPDVDQLVHGVLLSLSQCPEAEGVFGTLSLGFDLNLDKKNVDEFKSGKSTDLPGTAAEQLLACAKTAFASLDTGRLQAEHAGYTVYYLLEFKTPEAVIQEEGAITQASGSGTVRWESAQIRKEGSRDAEVVARLMSGARVVVTGKMGEWYRVKYDARGREGWVHGAALGLE